MFVQKHILLSHLNHCLLSFVKIIFRKDKHSLSKNTIKTTNKSFIFAGINSNLYDCDEMIITLCAKKTVNKLIILSV
jgi:3-polyprenyl-4-hydroxybenzoate decarboxylase